MAKRTPPAAGKGRPKGALNKTTVEIREKARLFLEDEKGAAKMLAMYRAGRLHPGVVHMLHHYAYGKPKETVEHSGPDGAAIAFSEIRHVIVDPVKDR